MDNPELQPLRDMPWLFSVRGLLLLAAVMLAGAAFGAAEVSLLAGTLVVIGVLARGWALVALRRLEYRRLGQTVRVFCGDSFTLETSLVNRKPVPLPWVEVWERVPDALQVEGEIEKSYEQPGRLWFSQGAALWPYQRARWRHTIQASHRGVFHVGEVWVRSGDPFSLQERLGQLAANDLEVIVYPRVVALQRISLPLRYPMLEAVGRRSLVTDPTRTATLREYQPGDSPRMIHWPTTARRGALQVRVPEPTTSLYVSLVLDLHGFAFLPVQRDAIQEMAISAIASVAAYLHGTGSPTSLYVSSDPPAALPMGAGAAHLQAILETLARLRQLPVSPLMPHLLEWLPRGGTVVLAASETSNRLARDVGQLEEAGYHVIVLLAGLDGTPIGNLGGRIVRLAPTLDLAAVLEGREA